MNNDFLPAHRASTRDTSAAWPAARAARGVPERRDLGNPGRRPARHRPRAGRGFDFDRRGGVLISALKDSRYLLLDGRAQSRH